MSQDLKRSALESTVGWIFLDAADLFFNSANSRVGSDGEIDNDERWDSLFAILEEIVSIKPTESLNVHIITSTRKSRDAISHILRHGINSYLNFVYYNIYEKILNFKYKLNINFEELKTHYGGEPVVINDESDWDSTLLNLKQNKKSEYPLNIYVQNIYAHGGYSRQLHDTLTELCPSYIILFEPKYSLIRQLEVYQCRLESPISIYFLMYTNSFEEELYLNGLSKERESFEQLAQQRSWMVPLDCDNSRIEPIADERMGGMSKKYVFADMREFRSDLPYSLYMLGMTILPITLEIGDYLICPGLCVERKNVSDLISSLHSGRLYTQCVAMCSVYTKPVLLVEFDLDRAFILPSKAQFSSEIVQQDLSSKLGLLSIAFPNLRFLWCSNPQAGASLLTELKRRRDDFSQEDIDNNKVKVVQESEALFSVVQRELLLKIKGVDQINAHILMSNFKNLAEICCSEADSLGKALLNSKTGNDIYHFCHFIK